MMKLLELEIQNIRGIRELIITPKGNNFVIWGPNGSGKSAVVDSIDFLLTGEISRLTGRGTRGISLNDHGPHIDCDPEEAWVRGVFQIPNIDEPIELRRCIKSSSLLEYDTSFSDQLEPVLEVAQRGQHVLTRRDILRYITAEASTRAKEIQEILNITEIERIRSALRRTITNLERDKDAALQVVENAKGRVNATIQQDKYKIESVLEFINNNREILSGSPITEHHSSRLKEGLEPPIMKPSLVTLNLRMLDRDIVNIRKISTELHKKEITKHEKELGELLDTFKREPSLLRELACLELIELGIKLIDETGSCPLCDTEWTPGELIKYLEEKQKKAREARKIKTRITAVSSTLARITDTVIPSLEQIINSADVLDEKEIVEELRSWLSKLEHFSDALKSPIDDYVPESYPREEIPTLFFPHRGSKILEKIQKRAHDEFPKTTPEQDAWDSLTRLEENLKALEEAHEQYEKAEIPFNRARSLYTTFIETRDEILQNTYDEVRDRFVDIYRKLHGTDESGFTASLAPLEAGLNFEVNFYGRGNHPPHALHSEGHQDSMGVSLWLALSEYLIGGVIELTILDDVVMSVDSGHRRQTCNLLASDFPDKQFLITTHDKTWVSQLKNGGVVDSSGILEFYNWHIDTGPQTNYQPDMWVRIEEDLQRNDVPSAAQKLRRGSEDFFRAVSDALEAKITFKEDYQWELGDYLPAAMGRYKDLLKIAKASAQSWGNKELFDTYQERDSIRSQIYDRSAAEKWAVNASIHYNNWTTFSESDFRPVIEAFQDLYALFFCAKCGGLLHLTKVDNIPQNVRCNCGEVNWNLVKK